MEAWGLTDPGNIRNENQDAFRIEPLGETALLTVVCDGMGGARSGSVASRLACEVFSEEVKRSFSPEMTPQEAERVIRSAAALANISVFEHSQLSEEFNGMGTTLVACLLYPKGKLVLNVGDSRAYLVDSDGIRCITTDHSVVEMMVQRGELTPEQAKTHPSKNLITRAIGTATQVTSDVFHIEMPALYFARTGFPMKWQIRRSFSRWYTAYGKMIAASVCWKLPRSAVRPTM